MDSTQEIAELKAEVARLKLAAINMTEALKVLTASDERAKEFIARVEEIITQR